MRRGLKRGAFALLVTIAIPICYIAASIAGALIPGGYAGSSVPQKIQAKPIREIILITSLLHADFAFPVDDALKEQLGFLSKSSFPLSHPNLKYVAVGWGSKAFYTTAGTYADIEAQAVFKAVAGDDAVMRFVAFGDVRGLPDTVRLELTDAQYGRLLDSIVADLKQGHGDPLWMRGVTIGENDAFYEALGHFNIFNPCNQWANRVLRDSGVPLGVWTPTAQAFKLSLTTYADAVAE